MRNILIFTRKWETGGIEAYIASVLQTMDRTDLHIDVFTCLKRESIFSSAMDRMGIQVHLLPGNNRRFVNPSGFRTVLKQRTYSAVHLNLYESCSMEYAQIAKEEKVPTVIVHSHNTDLHKGAGRQMKLLVQRICADRYSRYADLRWAVSSDAGRFMYNGNSFTIMKNGIDLDHFRFQKDRRDQERKKLNLGSQYVIGCIGRFCMQKNQTFLISLIPDMPDTVLLLVGDGEDEYLLKEQAERLGVSDRVIFHDVTEDTAPLYDAMDIFCMPSVFEGFGRTAIEAQASGLRTICSDRMPKEAAVSPLISFLALKQDLWEKEILSGRTELRPDTAEYIQKAGYDIHDIASSIGSIYRGDHLI